MFKTLKRAIKRYSVCAQIITKAAGTYSEGGAFIEGEETVKSVKLAIFPIDISSKGSELIDPAEGIRNEAKWLCWSKIDINNDDIIRHNGIDYRIMYKWDRSQIGGYFKFALGMLPK